MMFSTPPRPPAGNKPSTTAKIKINISPSQNAGIDWPSTANTRAARSITGPRCTAEYMPSGTPMRTLRNIATNPSSTVAGRRSQMLGDREAGQHGAAEVAHEDVLDVDAVLHGQGAVETQVVHQDL